ncbi:MAG: hypothetical protein M1831_001173 [Alyxoria varia]|nr:MAG: hypothetical protein M1831_001173 [Alyxoria varia]
MSVDIETISPALQEAVQAKVVEAGWSAGMDDSGLAEYIVLMVTNGKTQEELYEELTNGVITAEEGAAAEFGRWLFELVHALTHPQNGGTANSKSTQIPRERSAASGLPSQPADGSEAMMDASADPARNGQDADMSDAVGAAEDQGSIPTGPKSMRNGAGMQRGRDKRMLGQMNRTLNRTPDASLHRIKGTAATGRVNTHANRDPPKGPAPKGLRGGIGRQVNMPHPNQMNPQMQQQMNQQMNPMAMGNMPPQGNPFVGMSPQQQMQMMAMFDEQARMMSSLLTPGQQQNMPNMMGIAGNGAEQRPPPGMGKSLFDRVDTSKKKPRRKSNNQKPRPDVQMNGIEGPSGPDLTSSMEVEQASQQEDKPDPTQTVCRYNLFCTKADCQFVHQSPAAPPDVSIDMADECTFGAACTNRKCVGKHPSPAKRTAHKQSIPCKYYPNCTNPNCPFTHPATPPCRNGADCTVPGCKFAHNATQCKFNPCLNPMCPYKHVDGQKRGKFEDRVWINPEADESGDGGERQHLSERKFVDEEEEGKEELILPENMAAPADAPTNAPQGPVDTAAQGGEELIT